MALYEWPQEHVKRILGCGESLYILGGELQELHLQ